MSILVSSIYEVIKAGYVKKQARRSKRNWKTRYFLLTSGSLIYYDSHESLKTAKGDILLTKDTVVEIDATDDGVPARSAVTSVSFCLSQISIAVSFAQTHPFLFFTVCKLFAGRNHY